MEQRREPVLVQTFIARPPVEGLNVSVLVRLARLDRAQGNSPLVRPHHYRFAARILVVVCPVHLRQTALNDQSVQHTLAPPPPENGPFHIDGQGLLGGVVNDGQALDYSVFRGAIKHEIPRPNLIGGGRAQQGLTLADIRTYPYVAEYSAARQWLVMKGCQSPRIVQCKGLPYLSYPSTLQKPCRSCHG